MAQAVKQGLKTRRRWSARANGISGGRGDAGYRRGGGTPRAGLLVGFTMQEPPYLSSLRITLSDLALKNGDLEQKMRAQPGVAEVIIVPDEYSAYVKIDNQQISRQQLELLVSQA
ncbi:hypothetical protein BIY26_01525 [Brenneria goodwinii]|uniref:YajR YAM domain-containing protein n=1 Tax=Brenneria goodwinii TaxID=1109412 RepID=A0AAE8ETB9_9GAMM|nr:hypothetical protein BIY26_01525 [Brenneria goodwinii]